VSRYDSIQDKGSEALQSIRDNEDYNGHAYLKYGAFKSSGLEF